MKLTLEGECRTVVIDVDGEMAMIDDVLEQLIQPALCAMGFDSGIVDEAIKAAVGAGEEPMEDPLQEPTIDIKIIYGYFQLGIMYYKHDGSGSCFDSTWHHNPDLELSRAEQVAHNKKVDPDFKVFKTIHVGDQIVC